MTPGRRVPAQEDDRPPSAQVAVEALQRALACEHAAVWAYSTAPAFLPPELAARATADLAAHRTLRQDAGDALTELAERPISAQPAYSAPQPVVDTLSAGVLLVAAENDAIAAWRSLVERAPNADMRGAGMNRMTECTIRCAFWRRATEQSPAIPVFPGRT